MKTLGFRWRAWGLALVLNPLLQSSDCRAEAQPAVEEQQVKAAYLVGFARFLERSEGPAENIVICAAGDRRMVEALQRVTAGKGDAFVVRSADRSEQVTGCTVLFISPGKQKLLRELAESATDKRVLTVGEAPGFLDAGGALEFVWAGSRIQFNANVPALQKSGLRVSSRLLNLARNLRNAGGGQ